MNSEMMQDLYVLHNAVNDPLTYEADEQPTGPADEWSVNLGWIVAPLRWLFGGLRWVGRALAPA